MTDTCLDSIDTVVALECGAELLREGVGVPRWIVEDGIRRLHPDDVDQELTDRVRRCKVNVTACMALGIDVVEACERVERIGDGGTVL